MVSLLNKFICAYTIIFVFDRLLNQNILNACNSKIKTKLTFYTESYVIQVWFVWVGVLLVFFNPTFLLYTILTFHVILVAKSQFKGQYNLITLLTVGALFSSNIFLLRPSALNLTIMFEITNLLLIGTLLLSKKIQLTYKKTVYMVLITTNILVLSFLLINQTILFFSLKCWDFEICAFLLEYKRQSYIGGLTYLILLIKLGLLLGPKYNVHLYSTLDKTSLTVYMYFYYIIFILVSTLYFQFLHINPSLIALVWLCLFVTNRVWLTNRNRYQLIFYWSNQISLFYLQLLVL